MDLWTSWDLMFVLGMPGLGAHCIPVIALFKPSLRDYQVYRDILCHMLCFISRSPSSRCYTVAWEMVLTGLTSDFPPHETSCVLASAANRLGYSDGDRAKE